MLEAGGHCYRRLRRHGESPVSRNVHRLLRVPPTDSAECVEAEVASTSMVSRYNTEMQ